MRYAFTSEELLQTLRSSALEPNEASPFRALLTRNADLPTIPLREDRKLLCAFALTPEKTYAVGRHSSVDGPLYLLKIGPIFYLYSFLGGRDLHLFEAFFDRPRLLKFLQRNFCHFHRPNFAAFTHLDLRLTEDEFTVWNLIRALTAQRAGSGRNRNDPFPADDLKNPDVALYLRNYLDELGFGALSDRIDLLMDEKRHVAIETALQGLCEKGLLSVEMAGFSKDEPVYRLSRTAIERLDDGLLLDTVWFADRTDPKKTRELLFALRRDGVCAVIPNAKGVALRNFDQIPWEELI